MKRTFENSSGVNNNGKRGRSQSTNGAGVKQLDNSRKGKNVGLSADDREIIDKNKQSNGFHADEEPGKIESDQIDHDFHTELLEVEGDMDVTPIDDFNHPSISKSFSPVFSKFKSPTPIQKHTWPVLFANRDVVGIAKTGSGKTLAFGVPLVANIKRSSPKPSMLVLAPTRELAVQIYQVLEDLAKRQGLRAVVVYGGVARAPQKSKLGFSHIVVATPGRLLDFIRYEEVDVSQVSSFVLDEADQMLDMGFEPDITEIESHLPRPGNRITAMFSATWPIEIQTLAHRFLSNPIKISVGESSATPTANKAITQNIEFVQDVEKIDCTKRIISEVGATKKILIFTITRRDSKFLTYKLQSMGISCDHINSDLTQNQREIVLKQFKMGAIHILVATDVASRGLDIPNVEAVINYGFPQTVESYVHRIGRTGRAGKKGVSYTIISPRDRVPVKEFVEVLKKAEQTIPPELWSCNKTNKSLKSGFGHSRNKFSPHGKRDQRSKSFSGKGKFSKQNARQRPRSNFNNFEDVQENHDNDFNTYKRKWPKMENGGNNNNAALDQSKQRMKGGKKQYQQNLI